MYSYFCNTCGRSFRHPLPELDERGLHNLIRCPHCSSADTYPDTPEGAAASVRAQTEYENENGFFTGGDDDDR